VPTRRHFEQNTGRNGFAWTRCLRRQNQARLRLCRRAERKRSKEQQQKELWEPNESHPRIDAQGCGILQLANWRRWRVPSAEFLTQARVMGLQSFALMLTIPPGRNPEHWKVCRLTTGLIMT
jgi:hypothetical protein